MGFWEGFGSNALIVMMIIVLFYSLGPPEFISRFVKGRIPRKEIEKRLTVVEKRLDELEQRIAKSTQSQQPPR